MEMKILQRSEEYKMEKKFRKKPGRGGVRVGENKTKQVK
jgi:hypothetical protein